MPAPIRVRFAPSPTGPLHIGGVRTALFNYLFAKKHKGTFVLRIEDTDQARWVQGAEKYITESLEWLGIPFDEGPGKEGGYGPYRQSERKKMYAGYIQQLLDSGHAYYAFDTPEALDTHRKDHEARGKTFIYNWHNREKLENGLKLNAHEVQERIERGEPYVVRFKWPKDTLIQFRDLVRGEISIDGNTLDDKVLFKSDGMPTYHLANIVDDHLMEITHVIRGEEWLPSLALHVQLYTSFGWTPPQFAHLPLIMKPVGKGKLSKRDGDKLGFPVFPLSWESSVGYREQGYLPEAVLNFLALLGWNPGTEQEVFSLQALIEAFDLTRINKSGARFDPEKNRWFNQHYLQEISLNELHNLATGYFETAGISLTDYPKTYVEEVLSLVRERAVLIGDLPLLSSYFFKDPETYDEKAVKKKWREDTPGILEKLANLIKEIEVFSAAEIEAEVREWITQQELSFGSVMPALRLVIVGALQGPDLYKIMELIGKDTSLRRLELALERL